MSNNMNQDFPLEEEGTEPDHMETEREEDYSDSRWMEELRLVLVGKTGSGKSASGNTILGRRQFLSQISASSVTQICEQGSTELEEEEEEVVVEDAVASTCRKKKRVMRNVLVVDMPGFGDTYLSTEQIHAEIAKCVSLSAPGPHAFLLVVPIGRYSDNENQAVCEMAKIFGEDAVCNHTVVVFTRGDDLEGLEIEKYLNETAPAKLKALIDRCGGRYHVLNNKDPSNSAQVKELLMKVDKMVEQSKTGYYTNAMFLEAEAAIREEEKMMLRERGQAEGEEHEGRKKEEDKAAKQQKCDLECKGTESSESRSQRGSKRDLDKVNDDFRVERWTEESRTGGFSFLREQLRERHRGRGRAVSRRQALRSSLTRLRREAALSPKVLERVKILVAAGATGMAVGAVFGAAAPLAAAAGASLMGNSVGFAASQLACASVTGGTSVGKAVGVIVAATTGKTAVAVGAATGGVLGGSIGAIAGTEAASPAAGALDALEQVSVVGALGVGVAAGVGSTLGAGAALGAALGGGALSSAALTGADAAAAGAANASLASAAGQHAVATVASGTAGVAAPAAGAAVAQAMVASVPAVTGATGALCGITGPSMASTATRAMSDPWSTVSTTTRILNAVADIGKAAAGIALAGGLVVKVMKEKVRSGTGTTETSYSERNSYEIYWNK